MISPGNIEFIQLCVIREELLRMCYLWSQLSGTLIGMVP